MWERKLPIVIPLVGLGLAHWALLFRGMFIITAAYDPTTLSCVVTTTKHVFLSVTFWASRCLILPARLLWFSACSSSSASVGVVLRWLSVYLQRWASTSSSWSFTSLGCCAGTTLQASRSSSSRMASSSTWEPSRATRFQR